MASGVDMEAILEKATHPLDLLRTVQWVSKYLWFLSWDPVSASSPYFVNLLTTLAELQGVARPTPPPKVPEGAGGSFTGLGLCMRSVLDGLWERLGGRPGEASEGGVPPWATGAGGGEAAAEVDPRLMQLCCPLLDQARLNLQV